MGTQSYKQQPFTSVSAGATQTSSWIDTAEIKYASFHVVWSGVTGTGGVRDATIQVQVANDASDSTNPVDKANAQLTINTATGSDLISISGVATENFYRVRLEPGNVTAGTVNCYALFKD